MRTSHIVFFFIFLLIVWGAWGDVAGHYSLLFTSELNEKQIARAGQWGDSYGPFNALVSAAGFIVLTATLLVQARAIKLQALDLHKQRFDTSFFEFLKLLRELRAELTFSHSGDYIKKRYRNTTSQEEYKSSEAVIQANHEISFWLKEKNQRDNTTKEQISEIYMEYIDAKHSNTFGAYFRIIYTILSKIKRDKHLSCNEKAEYGNILRSQLTNHEVFLLAFNGLAPVSKDLGDLIVEFRMLKYLPPPPTRMRIRLETMYPAVAFAARD